MPLVYCETCLHPPSVGLIIDAFGELREKEEAVTDQLKVDYYVMLLRIFSVLHYLIVE